MNKKLILFSSLLGIIFSLYLYLNYKSNNINDSNILESKVYIFQVGVFKNYKNVASLTKKMPTSLVIEKNDLYYVYVGMTGNEENITKIKEILTNNKIYVKEEEVFNIDFLNYLNTCDEIISKTKDHSVIKNIQKELLKKYDEI